MSALIVSATPKRANRRLRLTTDHTNAPMSSGTAVSSQKNSGFANLNIKNFVFE
jgi:hypothetical protein